MEISTSYGSTSLSYVGMTAGAAFSSSARPAQASASQDLVSLSAEARALSFQSTSLSLAGAGFSLDLRHDELQVATEAAAIGTGPDGVSAIYSADAADLTTTNFSFTMNSAAPAVGNDDVSRIAKEVKPLAKEFMAATGARGGWGEINRFLRSVA